MQITITGKIAIGGDTVEVSVSGAELWQVEDAYTHILQYLQPSIQIISTKENE